MIEERIINIIKKLQKSKQKNESGIKEISIETNIVTDLGMSSIDLFSIISELEDELEIEFDDDEIWKMKTVIDIADAVKEKLAEN